jgi:S1-C subfamily serine protease
VALPLGDSDALQAGDTVTALGYPTSFADPATQRVVVTRGVVQSASVAAQPGASLPKLPSTVQHSATLNPGNSGGPLLNDRGEVVGINTLSNPDAKGQFYAISSNAVKQALPALSEGHNKGYAGWDLASFDEAYVADAFKQTGYGTPQEADAAEKYLSDKRIRGLLVFGVDVKSPAEDGKIEGGDFIEKINTVPVSSVTDVCDILLSASPGQTLLVEGEYLTRAGSHEAFTPWHADVKPA